MNPTSIILNSRYPNRLLLEFSKVKDISQSLSVVEFQQTLADSVFNVFLMETSDFFDHRNNLCRLDSWLEKKFTEESNRVVTPNKIREQFQYKVIDLPVGEIDDCDQLGKEFLENAGKYAKNSEWNEWISNIEGGHPLEPDVM